MESNDNKAAFISGAIREGKEASLIRMMELFGFSPSVHTLDKITAIVDELDKWNLSIFPDVSQGDINTDRLIKSKNPVVIQNQIDLDIRSFEGSHLEFKGSLLFDIKKHFHNPELPINQLRSEEVLYESLKSIAAFINCGGGILYIGVNDDGTIQGLHNDCRILGCSTFNPDIFQLEIRNQVTGKFLDGKTINDYIDIGFFQKEDLSFARLNINRRKKLAFVKKNNSYILYKRQGNRTAEVKIEEMEEFIHYRKDQGWSMDSI